MLNSLKRKTWDLVHCNDLMILKSAVSGVTTLWTSLAFLSSSCSCSRGTIAVNVPGNNQLFYSNQLHCWGFFSMFGLACPVTAPEGWCLILARFRKNVLCLEIIAEERRWIKWAMVRIPKHEETEFGRSTWIILLRDIEFSFILYE